MKTVVEKVLKCHNTSFEIWAFKLWNFCNCQKRNSLILFGINNYIEKRVIVKVIALFQISTGKHQIKCRFSSSQEVNNIAIDQLKHVHAIFVYQYQSVLSGDNQHNWEDVP